MSNLQCSQCSSFLHNEIISDVENSFECDFGLPFFYDGKDDYCGYIDDSPGPAKWVRSQEYYTDRKSFKTIPYIFMVSFIQK